MLGLQLFEDEIGCVADGKGKLAVFRIQRRRDKIVGGREPQAVGRVEHRKVLEMRVGVARQQANQNALIEPPGVHRRTAGRAQNECSHVVIGGVILVISGTLAEELIELLEMPFRSSAQAIEARNDECPLGDALQPCNDRIDDFVIRQQGAAGCRPCSQM